MHPKDLPFDRRGMNRLEHLSVACGTALGIALALAAPRCRDPALVSHPIWLSLFVASALCLIAVALFKARGRKRVTAIMLGAPAVFALVIFGWRTEEAAMREQAVLAAPRDNLRATARHVIAGFYTMDQARSFAKAGVAGLFIAPRNIRDRTRAETAADIAALQKLRQAEGLPPLWISADQEGGPVASLSPPLPRPPLLASLAADPAAVIATARQAAHDMACLGINLNFAPVADLDEGVSDPNDLHSRIRTRSIGSDQDLVIRTASLYCAVLAQNGVRCTIKHFPGLGGVATDTHVATAHLAEAAASDLKPFHALTNDASKPWVMLSHLTVDVWDRDHPVSASPRAIAVLRRDWGYDGILVTDDLFMAAYQEHLADNAVASLTGGADILLASYDPDVAFRTLAGLLVERGRNDGLRQAMEASDKRLARDPARTTSCE